MRLLLIGADRREFTGILDRCTDVDAPRAPLPARWFRSAKLNGHEVHMAANGVGAARAARAFEAAPAVDAVASVGFCGALDPALGAADVFVGTAVWCGPERYEAAHVTSGAAYSSGTVWSSPHVVRTAEEKAKLWAAGAGVVEMEAAGVAAEAARTGIPFFCVKSVSDLAGEDLGFDFGTALRPDGYFATMHILGQALRHPVERMPELVRLARRCERAARKLGDFFADCRF